jgi:hypothetical protein
VPDTTLERLRECVADHGGQLEPGRYYLNTHVRVDRDGINQGVSTNDIPKTSHDLTACMRVALREMAIPEAILQAPPTEDAAATMSRAYMGSPAVVVVVAVGLSEIVLEAGAITILFAVTVEVLNEAGKDIADAEDETEAAEREEARRNRGDTEFVRSISALFKRADAEGMSFEEELREMRRLEAESVQRAVDGGLSVPETKRRIIGWMLGRALERRAPLDVCRQIWEEQLERGFSNLERRLSMSGIYAECCQLHGAFDEGLAIIEPLIPETEQVLADTTLAWPERRDYGELLQDHRKLRDELKAGIRA